MKRIDFTYKVLSRFGLSEKEGRVYLEALKEDNLTPYTISKLTNIPRTTVYDVLMNLSLKGLVELNQSDGMTKQQTKVRAKNPSVLRKIIRKKHKRLNSLEADIMQILPDLKKDYHKDKSNAYIKFYPGIEGANKTYFDQEFFELDMPSYSWDMLLPMDAFGSEYMDKELSKEIKKRKEKRSDTKELIPLNDWTKHVLTYQCTRDKSYLDNQHIRVVDNPIFEIFMRLMIKGKYALITCVHEDEMWGLKVRSKALAKSLKSIYLLNWQMGTPVTKKLVKSWGKNPLVRKLKKKKN